LLLVEDRNHVAHNRFYKYRAKSADWMARQLRQKSGLSARGTSASFPGNQKRLSAHTISGQSKALVPSVR
jgi:hypothetical protein